MHQKVNNDYHAYIALVRMHLEYASAVFASASPSQLKKLDTIQKISSRIICGAPRDAHAAPLVQSLKLESLGSRRTRNVASLVSSCISDHCHPSFSGMFIMQPDGTVANGRRSRIALGNRRFSVFGKQLFNTELVPG